MTPGFAIGLAVRMPPASMLRLAAAMARGSSLAGAGDVQVCSSAST